MSNPNLDVAVTILSGSIKHISFFSARTNETILAVSLYGFYHVTSLGYIYQDTSHRCSILGFVDRKNSAIVDLADCSGHM